jgi:hypothetical protein
MCTASELLDANLAHNELRVLLVICKHSAQVDQTAIADELALDRTTVYRATKKLLDKGLLSVSRSRRNLGKYSKNVYELSAPSHVASHVAPDATWRIKTGSHHVAPTATSTADIDIAINNNIENKTTSYFRCEPAPSKRKAVIVGRGWQDDDAELAGFGLFDDEVPASQKQAPVSKRSSKTRNQRPQEDWTALDIAAEFMSKIYDKLPGISVPINTLQLQKIIAKNRKEYDLTPLIELELMRLFFDDYWFKNKATYNPQYIKASFLKFYNSHLPVALENLGLDSNKSVPESEVFSDKPAETIYASDGTPFDNSMPGRKDLELYEAQLRRTANEQGTFQS